MGKTTDSWPPPARFRATRSLTRRHRRLCAALKWSDMVQSIVITQTADMKGKAMIRGKRGLTAGVALAGAGLLALTGCGGSSASASSGAGGKVTLSLVAFSTPQAAYEKIIKAFQATPAGKNVNFQQSYGASGDQSRAVAAGLKADVVEFSLQPDMQRL